VENKSRGLYRSWLKIGESSAVGKSIIAYDPKSIDAQDFMALAKEVL
jgi:cellulose biosynthesis protein BcsQ